ncbi:MAG: hypothetical protein A3F72_00745 [Bacteroidetes bacterium RIFCSPLOWO2_12_FULL_35_15]|nr:MAG: hypothetical protein A3F72_00745 [Bacteroidetes bacterium RIFCSPLOWO2_12_FULL_35_15]
MLKGNRKYIFILVVCFTLLIVLQWVSPKPINWNLSYIKKDKIPFGTSALYEALPTLFPSQKITNATFPIYNILNLQGIENHTYIIINNIFRPDTLDTRELLKFAAEGNSVFIAANYFEGKFGDSLKLETDDYFDLGNSFNNDSAAIKKITKQYDTVKINFSNPSLKNTTNYSYVKGFEGTYLKSFDTLKSKVLGLTNGKEINFISMKIGKGKIFINTNPEAFSNYHFVSKNMSYVFRSLSCLPNQSIIWDEYYKAGNDKSDSPLRVIFNNPLLRNAYYLLLLSLIVFILFGIKRKQRIIPIIEPYRNTTLQFVDIVGTLYYQAGNHKNVADKKITYFLEFIRSAFQVKTTIYDDLFIERISNLSGIEKQKVHDLFYYFSDLSIKPSISQQELLKLNRLIEEFHKENKR